MLKVGTKLYRYCSGTGITANEIDCINENGTYRLSCRSCNCKIYISNKDLKVLSVAVEEGGCSSRDSDLWHISDSDHYHKTYEDAKKEQLQCLINRKKEQIKKESEELEFLQKEFNKLEL